MPEDYEANIQKLNGSGPIAPKAAEATKEEYPWYMSEV